MNLNTTEDVYSFAEPAFTSVQHIYLKLRVDFDLQILEGYAILNILTKHRAAKLILDTKGLVISDVINCMTGQPLKYDNNEKDQNIGSSLIIELPYEQYNPYIQYESIKYKIKIQIKYKTSENVALCWLTRTQTADGSYPFLLSNNQYTNARALFPCQDTPSVKFTYAAQISVPNGFKVIMSANLESETYNFEEQLRIYNFFQRTPIPAYAVVIVVGSLKFEKLSPRSNIYAETTYFDKSIMTFNSVILKKIEDILRYVKNFLKDFFRTAWTRYDICVLPPTVSRKLLKLEGPNVIFISPSLLGGDISLIDTIARQISYMKTERLVTCVSYQHLWLNKSLGIFIYKKIINQILNDERLTYFLERRINRTLKKKIEIYKNTNTLLNLIPTLTNIMPGAIDYVPYEVGCMLLEVLERILGGQEAFKLFFKTFENRIMNTNDWMILLYEFFPEKHELLKSFPWNTYFYSINFPIDYTSNFEKACYLLAEEWMKYEDGSDIPSLFHYLISFADVQKIKFLKCLYELPMTLSTSKLDMMLRFYGFQSSENYKIQFHWIRLCIKNQWQKILEPALAFANQFGSLNIALRIYQDLYHCNCSEVRIKLIESYECNKQRMSRETQLCIEILLYEKIPNLPNLI